MAVTPADALPVHQVRTGARVRQFLGASWRSYAVLGAIAAFLLALLLIPVGAVFITAFRDGDGSFTLGHFGSFFRLADARVVLEHSLYVAIASRRCRFADRDSARLHHRALPVPRRDR